MAPFDRDAWLSDPAEPAARYRYLVDIQGLPPRSSEARTVRAAIPRRGWASNLLEKQDKPGFWVHRKSLYGPKYMATNWNLLVLADVGLDAKHPRMRRALDLMVQDYAHPGKPFGGKKGPHLCFTGNMTRLMATVGLGSHPGVARSLEWLAEEQKEDGGWDCFGRKRGTLDGWEGLAAYAAVGPRRWTRKWNAAVERGAAFYLERGLLREGPRRYAAWERVHYPVHYYYDVLVGLETLTALGYGEDRRLRPALDLLNGKMRPDGTWAIDAIHPDLSPGSGYGTAAEWKREVPPSRRLALEPPGRPSKWVTLRALNVLDRTADAM